MFMGAAFALAAAAPAADWPAVAPWLPESPAPASPAQETLTASAERVQTVLTKTNQRRYDPVCPEGSIRVNASMQVSGWARLRHSEFLIPPEAEPPKGFNLKLPSGWTLHAGAGLAYGGGLGGFGGWRRDELGEYLICGVEGGGFHVCS